jgi:hypothetical protein
MRRNDPDADTSTDCNKRRQKMLIRYQPQHPEIIPSRPRQSNMFGFRAIGGQAWTRMKI